MQSTLSLTCVNVCERDGIGTCQEHTGNPERVCPRLRDLPTHVPRHRQKQAEESSFAFVGERTPLSSLPLSHRRRTRSERVSGDLFPLLNQSESKSAAADRVLLL